MKNKNPSTPRVSKIDKNLILDKSSPSEKKKELHQKKLRKDKANEQDSDGWNTSVYADK